MKSVYTLHKLYTPGPKGSLLSKNGIKMFIEYIEGVVYFM